MKAPVARQPALWRYLWGWVIGALVVVWSTMFAVAWTTGHHEAGEVADGQLVSVARLWLVSTPRTRPAAQPVPVERVESYVQDVAVLHWVNGRLVSDTHGVAPLLPAGAELSAGFSDTELAGPTGPEPWRVFVAERQGRFGPERVAVLMNMAHRIDLGQDMALHLASPALFVLPLVALLLWWAIRTGLRPLDRLSLEVAALDSLAGQRLDERHRFREFSSIVQAINTLVDSLKTRARREREFASDVAHELRTPLTALALQARAARDEPSAERLQGLEHEALRAGHILAQLLDLARAQQGEGRAAVAPVDLGDVAARLISDHAQLAFERGQELSLNQPEQAVTVAGPRLLVELALRNLIENALRHTPPGTQVAVAVWRDGAAQGVSVSDDGQRREAGGATPGASEGSGALPPSDTSGLGLGLRLVERIAQQLGAALERDTPEPPMTTRFTLRWPR
ncbi:MAG: ATP-binding protein [Hydrogenophaga sp.]|nr:ATP-binding protein [Hydrogenophaga sp.]